jgi:outer membrane immunogenic protein
MKKILLSATALSLALTASAFAADLPSRKAPIIAPPPPPMTWTGFYVGLNAGGGFGAGGSTNGSQFMSNLADACPDDCGVAAWSAGQNLSGFIGGGQVGYNYQFGASWLVGVEADIQGSTLSSSSSAVTPIVQLDGGEPGDAFLSSANHHHSLDWFGTLRGRVGWLFTPSLLVYGTGGLAYGGVSHQTNKFDLISSPADDFGLIAGQGNFSQTKVGWTVGGGLEWLFAPNWSVKAEYLYTDLGSVQFQTFGAGTLSPDPAIFFATQTTPTRFHTVRAGVNYHFNWGAPAPVLAKY